MNCPNCGKEINKNQKFCKNCGYEIPKEPTSLEKAIKYCSNYWQKILLIGLTTCLLTVVIMIGGLKLYNSSQINIAMNEDFDGQKILVENVRKEKLNSIYDFLNRKLEDKYHGGVYIAKIYNDKAIIYAESNINPNDIISYLSNSKLEFKKQGNNDNSWIDTDLNSNYIKKAESTVEGSGECIVSIEFTNKGKEKFAQLTKEQTGKYIAIFFDNELITAPKIQEPITSGYAQITGSLSCDEAEQMAQILSVGLELKILKVK